MVHRGLCDTNVTNCTSASSNVLFFALHLIELSTDHHMVLLLRWCVPSLYISSSPVISYIAISFGQLG